MSYGMTCILDFMSSSGLEIVKIAARMIFFDEYASIVYNKLLSRLNKKLTKF